MPNENDLRIRPRSIFICNFVVENQFNLNTDFMKIRTVFLWVCLLIFLGAEAKSDSPTDTTTLLLLNHKESDKNRPKAPSRVHVECTYDSERMSFSFPGQINSYAVYVYNENDEWYGYVTREEPNVYISMSSGTYTIECTANDGRVFIGTIEF